MPFPSIMFSHAALMMCTCAARQYSKYQVPLPKGEQQNSLKEAHEAVSTKCLYQKLSIAPDDSSAGTGCGCFRWPAAPSTIIPNLGCI